MPPRSQPTARQVRLGVELRRLREAAGMTAREVAVALGSSSVHMSQTEAGIAGVSEARVRRLAAHYACVDAELIDALVAMATERTRGWWEEYRDVLPVAFLDLSELEHHACSIREVGTDHVPGLLQTEEYARAVFKYWRPGLPSSELEPRVAHRKRRGAILDRADATPYEAVLHESVLRTRVADRKVARAQLERILDHSTKPNVTVCVIPFDVDNFAGAGTTMMYASGPVPALDTVHMDTVSGGVYVDAVAQLHALRSIFETVTSAALEPSRSRDYIHRLAKEI
ncbi:helix-turn-helix domain-containing protein [Streptomyces sp. NBC_00237]|uniref:helix-turn-helix domain-containing protein n=1 Tax=Streptomyces sp. NBC_00237 TaxID=2975687 RepID=UPI00225418D9|nr:helix-turn-helix transcriptional regulator [Streptomyces sp. NBC_00237]MCX5204687.1 helix-turn-helix domain-containing protein [Streptomyces sp. NBC_00237]